MRSTTFISAFLFATTALAAIDPIAVDANSRPVLKDVYILQRDDGSFAKRDLNGVFETIQKILKNAGIKAKIRERFELDSVFSGASVKVDSNVTVADLEALPGIKKAWPVRIFDLPKPFPGSDSVDSKAGPIEATRLLREGLSPRAIRPVAAADYANDRFPPHLMTQVNVTHAKGLLGKGIKIGVIDSGVDYTNPILGGCFGPGCLISFGFDLVGDAYTGANRPVPGGSKGPFTDCNVHGTHVTGTIAALPNKLGFTGVAPEATIGHYRIFGCEGSASEDVIFAAMMRGIQDKCDILTLSLGGSGGWVANSPTEILMDSLAAKGVVVTVAAGNSGSEGPFFAAQPASTVNQISVASTDTLDTRTPGLISAFSNHGPTYDMYGQPTLSAPGGNILSTFPLALGGTGTISGTSMATPFMAGAAAVLMAARRGEGLTPLQIRSLLTTTAKIAPSKLVRGSAAASVIRQGGGLLQLAKAVSTYTLLSPNELLLNDTRSAAYDQTITINNRNKAAVTYTFSSIAAEALAVYAAPRDNLIDPTPEAVPATASLAFSVPSATVQPGGTFQLRVKFTPPQLSADIRARFPIFSGWVKIDSSIDSLTIPYFGLAASVFDMPVLDLSSKVYGAGLNFPFLYNTAARAVQSGAGVYRLGQGPTLFSRLAGGTRSFNVDLVDARVAFTPTARNLYESRSPARGSSRGRASTNATITERDLPSNELAPIVSEASLERRQAAGRLYSATPIIGNVIKQTNVYRDNLVDGGSTPYTDTEFPFSGTYDLPGTNRRARATAGVSYRLLIRALKNSGNPALESSYESWLSSPFSFSR